jgi:hypothetical protein
MTRSANGSSRFGPAPSARSRSRPPRRSRSRSRPRTGTPRSLAIQVLSWLSAARSRTSHLGREAVVRARRRFPGPRRRGASGSPTAGSSSPRICRREGLGTALVLVSVIITLRRSRGTSRPAARELRKQRRSRRTRAPLAGAREWADVSPASTHTFASQLSSSTHFRCGGSRRRPSRT